MNQFAGNTVIASLKEHGASRFLLSSYFRLTANEKDFSHSLEMTIGGKKGTLLSPLSPYGEGGDGRHSPSFRGKEVPRRGGGWLPQRDEKKREESALSYRHPERSRGIFFVCRFLFPA